MKKRLLSKAVLTVLTFAACLPFTFMTEAAVLKSKAETQQILKKHSMQAQMDRQKAMQYKKQNSQSQMAGYSVAPSPSIEEIAKKIDLQDIYERVIQQDKDKKEREKVIAEAKRNGTYVEEPKIKEINSLNDYLKKYRFSPIIEKCSYILDNHHIVKTIYKCDLKTGVLVDSRDEDGEYFSQKFGKIHLISSKPEGIWPYSRYCIILPTGEVYKTDESKHYDTFNFTEMENDTKTLWKLLKNLKNK